MDPPPPATTAVGALYHHQHPDTQESSSVSSPTSRQWDDSLPPPKLRMMCSYGGHIIPRPHDKSLCYMGGETRIVVADRHTSLADLSSRLSRTLLNGRQFSLKYQLPSEDLDSLVSVTTDEDLDNMIDEYDRLNSSNTSSKPSRLRLFLFLLKPETAASMGSLLDDAKSETWFVDALNGAGLLPRGLSDSAAIDNLLELKDDGAIQDDRDNYTESETQNNCMTSKTTKGFVQDVQSSLPDSPMVETTSSFGSSSSSPSISNLPPIKVRLDHMDQMAGLDEQLSHLNVSVAPPPLPMGWSAAVTSGGSGIVSDDERSDHGAASGRLKKPPLPLQPVQRKIGHDAYSLPSPDSKHGGPYNLQSPDSVASDSSIASATYLPKHAFTQDPHPPSTRGTAPPPAATQIHPNITTSTPDINYQIPIQQILDSVDTQPPPPPPSQDNQDQQLYHAPPHYIHRPTTNQPPISSYYPVYATPQLDHQQYPLYFLPVSQNYPYNMQMQSPVNPVDAATSNPSTATTPPLYPSKTTLKPNMVATSLYRPTTPGMIQVPSNQFPQQYVNLSHHPPTTMPTSNGGSYGYEYAQPAQDQVYYSQQYQTMNPASAMLLTQVSSAQAQAQQQGSESGK